MRHLPVVSFAVAVAVSLVVAFGCSSSSDGGTPGGTAGASTPAGGSTGTAGAAVVAGSPASTTAGAPGASGAPFGVAGTAAVAGSGGASSAPGGAGGAVASTGGAAGAAGSPATVDCSSASGVISYPSLPGAVKSPTYTVSANGADQFVEQLTKFNKEMQVHYAYFGVAKGCTANISVTVASTFSSFKLSPKSRNITATKTGNTLTFSSGANYLILQVDTKELLFILIDDQETSPPKLGDANVKNIADYMVDNTGGTVETTKIQAAITAASGATQNILYFPPGKYKTGELSLKSNMTMYLAAGAMIDGSTKTSDYAAAGPAVEDTTHGLIHLNGVMNTNILGRGVIDAEGTAITAGSNDTPTFKINAVRIDKSSMVLIDGVLVRDPVFWNTLTYMSDHVVFQNYKVINRRPTTTTYNQTDGVDFDSSNDCSLTNSFVYSGDDNLSPKTEQESMRDTTNITYQHAVLYSNSGACKIGTKTFGTTMSGIVFKDIDIVKAGRAMVIDANDTALISGTLFQDIRIEAADSNLIDLEEDNAPTWRTAPNTSIAKDTSFTNVSADVKQLINIHGKSASVNINGVHFSGFTVQGKTITSQTDTDASWSINSFVTGIDFK